MPSVVYDSALAAMARGEINFAADAFAVVLVGAGYSPDKNNEAFMTDLPNDVSHGGFSESTQVEVSLQEQNNRIEITLGGADWPASTITARGAIYYKRGGQLVAYIDFGDDVISTNGTFALTSSILRIQN